MYSLDIYLLFVWEMVILGLYAVYVAIRSFVLTIFPRAPKSLRNEIVLITGGANGIGREICRKLCETEKDLTIISWDVDEAKNEALIQELRESGVQRAVGFTVDVSDSDKVEAAARRVREEVGCVTVLINNAGIAGDIGEGWKIAPSSVQKVLGVNFLAHCWALREFIPDMIVQKKGQIVTVCSILGFTAGPGGAAYVASKHALKGYMESIKEDLRKRPDAEEIKVTIAFPHNTLTNLSAKASLRAGKYPFLFPQLQPKYVASKIVSALLREDEYVYIPGYIRFFHMIMSFLPPEVIRRSIDIADIVSEPSVKAKPA